MYASSSSRRVAVSTDAGWCGCKDGGGDGGGGGGICGRDGVKEGRGRRVRGRKIGLNDTRGGQGGTTGSGIPC